MRYAEVIKNIDPNILLDTENRQLTKSQTKNEESFKLASIFTSRKTEKIESSGTMNFFSNKGKNLMTINQNPSGNEIQSRPPSNHSKETKPIKTSIKEVEILERTEDITDSMKKTNSSIDPIKTKTVLKLEDSKIL